MTSSSIRNSLAQLSFTNLGLDMSRRGRILLKGPDARTFLQRLSTNEVESLKVQGSSLNVLANQKGRMVDIIHQAILSEDEVLLITSPERGSEIAAWLDQFLFTEDVTIEDISTEGGLAFVMGEFSKSAGNTIIKSHVFVDEKKQSIDSYLIYNRQKNTDTILSEITPKSHFLDQETFDALRIAAGIPSFPEEINDSFNPLELGLEKVICWTKGCYIGQEVISRLDTYQKQSKQLCLVTLKGDNSSLLKPQQKIHINDQLAGQITSVASLSEPGYACALAIIKLKSGSSWLDNAQVKSDGQNIPVTLTKITP